MTTFSAAESGRSEAATAAAHVDAGPAPLRAWLAVGSVSVGAFAFVTTEFMPVGLLTAISADLGISEGMAGQMVTIPGFLAAVAAPILAVSAGKIDRRIILWVLTAMAILSNLAVAFAPSLPLLFAGRILLGLTIGGFWSYAVSLGLRLVPSSAEKATAIIFAGISLGTVCGVPVGTLIGDALGWRAAFLAAAGLAALVLLAQILYLPPLPVTKAIRPRDLPALFRVAEARVGLMAVVFVITGQFAAYTYLRPLLEHVALLDAATITAVLVAYGVTGIVGNFIGGMVLARSVKAGLVGATLLLALALLATSIFGADPASAILLVGLWGLAFGAVPLAFQTWMFKAAPDALESGSALLVSTFQISLASGALAGGLVVDGFGVLGALLLGGVLVLAGSAIVAVLGRRPSDALVRA